MHEILPKQDSDINNINKKTCLFSSYINPFYASKIDNYFVIQPNHSTIFNNVANQMKLVNYDQLYMIYLSNIPNILFMPHKVYDIQIPVKKLLKGTNKENKQFIFQLLKIEKDTILSHMSINKQRLFLFLVRNCFNKYQYIIYDFKKKYLDKIKQHFMLNNIMEVSYDTSTTSL